MFLVGTDEKIIMPGTWPGLTAAGRSKAGTRLAAQLVEFLAGVVELDLHELTSFGDDGATQVIIERSAQPSGTVRE